MFLFKHAAPKDEEQADPTIRALFWASLCFLGAFTWLWVDIPQEFVRGRFSGRDFDCLWVAARMALGGHSAAIFDATAFNNAMHAMLPGSGGQIYSYPPSGLFIALPFGLLPYPVAFIAWDVVTLAFFVWAARPYLSDRLPFWVAAFSPGAIICLGFGHYGLLCSGLFLWSFRGSGWAAAVLTFKPHMGILVAVQMLRDRRAFVQAVAGTLILVALSLAVFGWQAWVDFVTVSLRIQLGRLGSEDLAFLQMQVTPAAGYGLIGQPIFGGLAILLLTRCFNVFTAATATFLIAPYGFHYDMPAACLGLAFVLAHRFDEMPLWQRIAAALAFCVPGLTVIGTWLSPPLLLGGLYVQVYQFRRMDPSLFKAGRKLPGTPLLPSSFTIMQRSHG